MATNGWIYNSHAPVPVEQKLFRVIAIAEASTYSSEASEFGSGQAWHYHYGAKQLYTTAPIIYASNS